METFLGIVFGIAIIIMAICNFDKVFEAIFSIGAVVLVGGLLLLLFFIFV